MCVDFMCHIAVGTQMLLTRVSISSYCVVTFLQQHPSRLPSHVTQWDACDGALCSGTAAVQAKFPRLPCKTCHMCASDVYQSAYSSRHVLV